MTAVAVVGPATVAVSRLYRGMHFPTDVATGVLLGAACLVAAALIVQAMFPADESDREPDGARA